MTSIAATGDAAAGREGGGRGEPGRFRGANRTDVTVRGQCMLRYGGGACALTTYLYLYYTTTTTIPIPILYYRTLARESLWATAPVCQGTAAPVRACELDVPRVRRGGGTTYYVVLHAS